MAFDGLVLSAVRKELEDKLLGGRISKVYQPEKEEIVLHIRSLGENLKLAVSAHAQRARLHLTAANKENPQSPPMFCMILRKYLEGGKITRIEQPGLERILRIHIEAYDELGRLAEKILVVEIMGKHSNIILLDPESNTILDGIKRYTHATSRHREVLPGRTYILPPAQEKYHPAHLDLEKLQEVFLTNSLETRVAKVLLQHIDGLSPESCREILVQSSLPEGLVLNQCGAYEFQQIWQTLQRVGEMTQHGNFTPSLVRDLSGQARAFSALELQQYNPLPKEHHSMNTVLDIYYTEHQFQESIRQQKHHLEQVIHNEVVKLEKKLSIQNEVLLEAAEREKYKLYGELLTANMYLLSKGMSEVTVVNYYHPEQEEITIPLDNRFTPSQQVQNFYKKYTKAKTSAKIAQEYITAHLEEIKYLESVLTSIEQAVTRSELAEIKTELGEVGYIKYKVSGKKNSRTNQLDVPKPLEFLVTQEYTVLVGKNNRQNDYLTLKLARPDDLWLHVKDIPGSHVIIRSQGKAEVPEAALRDAAQLAAYYSQGRLSGQVPVDYTLRKNVRKPRSSKPGMVIYEQQKTLYVTPAQAGKQVT